MADLTHIDIDGIKYPFRGSYEAESPYYLKKAAGTNLTNSKTWDQIYSDIQAANRGELNLKDIYKVGDYKEITIPDIGSDYYQSKAEYKMKTRIIGIDTYLGVEEAARKNNDPNSPDYGTFETIEIKHHIDWMGEIELSSDSGNNFNWGFVSLNIVEESLLNETPYINTHIAGGYLPVIFVKCIGNSKNGNLKKYIIPKYMWLEKNKFVSVNGPLNGTTYGMQFVKMGNDAVFSNNQSFISNADLKAAQGKLWLPTEYELFGSNIYGTGSAGVASRQYEYFKNSPENRGLSNGNGKAVRYWTATTCGDTRNIVGVDVDGCPRKYDFANTKLAVPLCFRLAEVK